MKLVSLERTPAGCIVIFEHCGVFSRHEISAQPDAEYRAYRMAQAASQARRELGCEGVEWVDQRILDWVRGED